MSPRFERGPDKRMGAGGRGAGRPQRFSGPKPEWKRDADAGGRERPSRDGGSRDGGSRQSGFVDGTGLRITQFSRFSIMEPCVLDPEEKVIEQKLTKALASVSE
jgi:hypothetical protein